jgi:hypothetical protein
MPMNLAHIQAEAPKKTKSKSIHYYLFGADAERQGSW